MAQDIVRVSPWHLRRLFNRGGFAARVASGQLTAICIKNKHLSVEQAAKQEQAYCTHSQILRYLQGDIRVAIVHQYVPPGTKEPTMPDPKYLEIDGRIYKEWPKNLFYRGLGWISGIRYKFFG